MNQHHTPLTFRPVPAVPIVVEWHRKDEWVVRTPAGRFFAATMGSIIDAAQRAVRMEKR